MGSLPINSGDPDTGGGKRKGEDRGRDRLKKKLAIINCTYCILSI